MITSDSYTAGTVAISLNWMCSLPVMIRILHYFWMLAFYCSYMYCGEFNEVCKQCCYDGCYIRICMISPLNYHRTFAWGQNNGLCKWTWPVSAVTRSFRYTLRRARQPVHVQSVNRLNAHGCSTKHVRTEKLIMLTFKKINKYLHTYYCMIDHVSDRKCPKMTLSPIKLHDVMHMCCWLRTNLY